MKLLMRHHNITLLSFQSGPTNGYYYMVCFLAQQTQDLQLPLRRPNGHAFAYSLLETRRHVVHSLEVMPRRPSANYSLEQDHPRTLSSVPRAGCIPTDGGLRQGNKAAAPGVALPLHVAPHERFQDSG